ncbi:MAG: glucosaminidase domain-containing protein [Desulfurivibrionaceae bacterium]|nr:glucosaminidase domain-containing protein [Desulfurivibrionaceae bacterium]
MTKIPFPSSSKQWLGLATGTSLLALALAITFSKCHPFTGQGNNQLQTIQAKHVPLTGAPKKLKVSSAQEVWDYYQEIGFTMENLERGQIKVPRIYLANIIDTWSDNESIAFKKSLFYRTMLPLILRVNELIAGERQQLTELVAKRKEGTLTARESQWLQQLARAYKVTNQSYQGPLTKQHLATLFSRVDSIPPSMALGQAAYESAYATSRFAMEGNALFGQWRWGSGLVPAQQREGLGDYRIADFKAPLDSMAAFARNLNTNKAYVEFRRLRSDLRRRGEPLDGHTLAAGLEKYSERGALYIETLRQMMRHNNLGRLDVARLGSGQPISLIPKWADQEQ